MDRYEPPGSETPTHETIQASLPWYDNDSLQGMELERVELHLSECERCRAELASLREFRTSLGSSGDEGDDAEAPAGNFAEVMARIDAEDLTRRRTSTTRRSFSS